MNSKKFGTFAGVFTPSILTILGVIMYLRVPYLVGQAGLYWMVGIILVAHVVSITTGLSVASISTNKKIETGGVYYIISRSLGLSIGGTLGIALFVGMSFGVSLYVIGFSESLNNFLDIENTKASLRLTGSITLALVTLLTFISTSLALKTQFFILAAVVLSLISIFAGQGVSSPAQPLLLPAEDPPDVMILFGIFFPSVTGFTAGVAMSGDLKDPKKSIPWGSILAIIVGLGIYMALTIFLSFRASREQLIMNPTILEDIALSAPLVIAGIWSATLSSAIGSILGAPRILQAMSMDKITPSFFGKSYGKSNEPRNALLFAYLIAEFGVLLGELDVIARIVSIFFLTTYGVLNLSCAIESWTGSDFHPSFKIPNMVSVIGAVSCFWVMLKLDPLAMIGGAFIMAVLFIYLQRRALKSEFGDAWEGVWTAVIRRGLYKLSHRKSHRSNWRPNILLFSGGSTERPHLVDFGEKLVGRFGFISSFDLIENPKSKVLFSKVAQDISYQEKTREGVFVRRQECRDVYEGIATIARSYGFSGIVPNTILMGWAEDTREPEKYADLLQTLITLDFNLCLLRYRPLSQDQQRKQINVWWRGSGNNGNFTLALLKSLLSTSTWKEATLRFIIIVEESAIVDIVYNNMTGILESARLKAEIQIVDNSVKKQPFPEILQSHSKYTDLTILGMPLIPNQHPEKAIERTTQLLNNVGTVLLVQASSFFKDVLTGIEKAAFIAKKPSVVEMDQLTLQSMELPPLQLPNDDTLKTHVSSISQQTETMLNQVIESHWIPIHRMNRDLIQNLVKLIHQSYQQFDELLKDPVIFKRKNKAAKIQNDVFFQIDLLFSDFQENDLPMQKEHLNMGVGWWKDNKQIINEAHQSLKNKFSLPQLISAPEDHFSLRLLKWRLRLRQRIFNSQPSIKVPFRKILKIYLRELTQQPLMESLHQFETLHGQLIQEIQNLQHKFKDSLEYLESQLAEEHFQTSLIERERDKIGKNPEKLIRLNDEILYQTIHQIKWKYRNQWSLAIQEMQNLDINKRIKSYSQKYNVSKNFADQLTTFPQIWFSNQSVFISVARLDLAILTFRTRLNRIMQKIKDEWFLILKNDIIDKIEQVCNSLENASKTERQKPHYDAKMRFNSDNALVQVVKQIRPIFEIIPVQSELIIPESLQRFQEEMFQSLETDSVAFQELVEHLTYRELFDPLQFFLNQQVPRFRQIHFETRDMVRLIGLSMENREDRENTAQGMEVLNILADVKKRLYGKKSEVETLRQELMEFMDGCLEKVHNHLHLELIIEDSKELKRYAVEAQSKKTIESLGIKKQRWNQWLTRSLAQLVYQQSVSSLLLSERRKRSVSSQMEVEDVMRFVARLMPKKSVLKSLPLQYKQLFLGEHLPNRDFWVGREDELNQAGNAIQRFKEGHSGALMVTGARFSGRASLSHYISKKYFPQHAVFEIFPPKSGSSEVSTFQRGLEQAFNKQGKNEELLSNLPQNSVLVFHDIEMWWERNEEGWDVINNLFQLIEQFSHQTFFILNINIDTLKFIRKLKKIDGLFTGEIHCDAFNARELKKIIMLRHRAMGFEIQWKQQKEHSMSELTLARLFNQYFLLSQGNVGVALHNWIQGISRFEKGVLWIDPPEPEDFSCFKLLSPEWIVVLIQFVLHKYLTIPRLAKILGQSEMQTQQVVRVLQRAGLLVESGDSIFGINPYVEPYLHQSFTEMKII